MRAVPGRGSRAARDAGSRTRDDREPNHRPRGRTTNGDQVHQEDGHQAGPQAAGPGPPHELAATDPEQEGAQRQRREEHVHRREQRRDRQAGV